MTIKECISFVLRNYKAAHNLSMNHLAAMLGIAVSSLQKYMDGTANPRADTIELIAKKLHIPIITMVSGPASGWERAETVVRAVKEIGNLPASRRAKGVRLFLQFVTLFAEDT